MKKLKFLTAFAAFFISFTVFNYYSTERKVIENQEKFVEVVSKAFDSTSNSVALIKRATKLESQSDEQKLDIEGFEENSDLRKVFENHVSYEDLLEGFSNRQGLILEENYARGKIKDLSFEVLDRDTFTFVTSFDKGLNTGEEEGIGIIKKAASNSVSFSGIDISPKTSKWIYDRLLRFIDSKTNNYPGLLEIAKSALYSAFPAFMAKFTGIFAGIANKLTDYFASLGGWGILVKIIIVLFAIIAAIIVSHILWAGAHNKGFRMGLQWTGWFRAKWVYMFYV